MIGLLMLQAMSHHLEAFRSVIDNEMLPHTNGIRRFHVRGGVNQLCSFGESRPMSSFPLCARR